MMLHTLLTNVRQALLDHAASKTVHKKRTRPLQIEELEPREMLSAAPLSATPSNWNWDQWWNNFDSTTLQVNPLPANYNTNASSDDFGQINIGGNHSQITAAAPFIPDAVNDLAAYHTAARQNNTAIQNGSGNPIAGVNTETITIGILSHDLGGGDWNYTEAGVYTYNLTSGDDLYWGGYSYYVSSSFTSGICESTFSLTTNDYFSINDTAATTTDDASSGLTMLTLGSVTETVVTAFYHNTVTSQRTASDTRTTIAETTLSGTGNYSYLVADSVISGTITQSGTHLADSSVTLLYTGTDSGWDISGSQSAQMIDTRSSNYQGGGDYAGRSDNIGRSDNNDVSLSVSGTIIEHGSETENLTLTVSGILDGDWSLIGSGTVITGSDDFYSNIGFDNYTQTASASGNSQGNSMALTGNASNNRLRENNTNGTIQLSLVDGEWAIASGLNESSGQSNSTTQYREDGCYSYDDESGSSGGTLTRIGNSEDRSNYTITSTYLLGNWQTTGNACGSGCDHSCSFYNGSGTYTLQNGGSNFTLSGTSCQDGEERASMTYQTESTLQSDGSWLTSGTGCETGCSRDHSSYIGGGSFTMTIDDPNVVVNHNSGTVHHDGESRTSSIQNADWALQNGEWKRTNGTGTLTANECSHSDYNGNAGLTEHSVLGDASYSTTTMRGANGFDNSRSQTTIDLSVVNGEWNITSGSGTGCTESHSFQDFITGGGYSSSSSGVTGTFCSLGHDSFDSEAHLQFTWNGSQWNTTGTFELDTSSSLHGQQIGEGTISAEDFSSTRSEHFIEDSSSESHWQEQLYADGSQVLVSGTGTNTFSHDHKQTADQTETLSETKAAGGGTLVSSGVTTINNEWTSNGFGCESFAVINNAWALDGGNYSVTDTDDNKVTTNSTGTLSQGGNQEGDVIVTQWDLTGVTTTINGNVAGSAGYKEWVYSGDDTYKTGGDYSYTETPRETEYHRSITGGTLTGTVKDSFSKSGNYESETKSHLDQGSADWIITFGTASAAASLNRSQSYEGEGDYQILSGTLLLEGTVKESGLFSAVLSGRDLKSSYNPTTNEWEESEDSNEGTMTYIDTVSFNDSGCGSEGNVTINDRTTDYHSDYTETLDIETGVTDYTLSYSESTNDDAEENRNTYNGIGGTYTKTSVVSAGFTLGANWSSELSEIDDWTGIRTVTFSEDHAVDFTQEDDHPAYKTYTDHASDVSSGTLEETLSQDKMFEIMSCGYDGSAEDLLWGGDVWNQSSFEADTTESVSTEYTKSTTMENMYSAFGGYGFIGTAVFEETSRYSKMLHKHDTNDTVTGGGYECRFSSLEDSFTSSHNEEYEIGCGCSYGCGCNTECGYSGKFNGSEFQGGTGSLTGCHHAGFSSDTGLTYTWTDGAWSITGESTTKKGFDYDWSDTACKEHETGCISGADCGHHEEEGTVKWDYASGVWTMSSVTGCGCGTYGYCCDWDSCSDYERAFYDSTITGTECAYSKHHRNDTWSVTFRQINGRAVRETEGSSTETIDRGCSYCGCGTHEESNDTTSNSTYCYNGTGVTTSHFERDATHCESGSQSYFEKITAERSSKANAQGQLVQQQSADAYITIKADADYCSYLHEYSCSRFDGEYDSNCNSNSGCGCYCSCCSYYSYSCSHTDSETDRTIDVSEHYTITLNEDWHSDGGAFCRISFDGTACGGGCYDSQTSSCGHSDQYYESGYSCFYGGNIYSTYRYYNGCGSDSCSEQWNNIDYDFTASWSWNNDNEISASVLNHVTGDIGGTSSSSWEREYGSEYSCGCGCSYGCSCCGSSHSDSPDGDYDETMTRIGWKSSTPSISFTNRWQPFSGSVNEDSYSCIHDDGGGCCCNYSYSCFYGYFNAPNFDVYFSEYTYNGDTSVSAGTSHAGHGSSSNGHSSMPVSKIPDSGGRYYSEDYYYNSYYYAGNGNINAVPSRDTGLTMCVPSPLVTAEPDFAEYASVNVEAHLPPIPEVAVPAAAPVVTTVAPVITSKHIGKSDVGFFGAFLQELGPAYSRNADNIQSVLDVGGAVPVIGIPADALNGTIHAVRGNKAGVVMSGLGMVPFVGDTIQGGKIVAKAGGVIGIVVKNADDVGQKLSKNLSDNLKNAGIHPPKGMKNPQAHHDLPQAFRKDFETVGIDINDPKYGRWVPGALSGVKNVGTHQNWSSAYNKKWQEFFDRYPEATREQILNFMHKLRNEFPPP